MLPVSLVTGIYQDYVCRLTLIFMLRDILNGMYVCYNEGHIEWYVIMRDVLNGMYVIMRDILNGVYVCYNEGHIEWCVCMYVCML